MTTKSVDVAHGTCPAASRGAPHKFPCVVSGEWVTIARCTRCDRTPSTAAAARQVSNLARAGARP